ncbi:OLC1v1035303C1 [Oldenlandia corymbosa var. corymbosa]|uniref:OLC1v1035303C1 n=1 Tax=Oldenlandia corymbosa var. corymbosa TaxID=529605 RepID=A0AAV1CSM9_OLDCO|nr:OLC1v1035303C1 [Oldenlandia corymbosa var. corymbosa]
MNPVRAMTADKFFIDDITSHENNGALLVRIMSIWKQPNKYNLSETTSFEDLIGRIVAKGDLISEVKDGKEQKKLLVELEDLEMDNVNNQHDTGKSLSLLSTMTSYGTLESFMKDAELITVDGIKNVGEACHFVTVGKIVDIIQGDDWFYVACRKCNRKVDFDVIKSDGPLPDGQFSIGQFNCPRCPTNKIVAFPRVSVNKFNVVHNSHMYTAVRVVDDEKWLKKYKTITNPKQGTISSNDGEVLGSQPDPNMANSPLVRTSLVDDKENDPDVNKKVVNDEQYSTLEKFVVHDEEDNPQAKENEVDIQELGAPSVASTLLKRKSVMKTEKVFKRKSAV